MQVMAAGRMKITLSSRLVRLVQLTVAVRLLRFSTKAVTVADRCQKKVCLSACLLTLLASHHQ